MKIKIERYYFGKFVLVLLLFIAFACTKNFEEINTPPTTSISIDAGYLLTTAQVDLARSESVEYTNNIWGSWVQHWCGGPLFSPSRYIPAPTHLTSHLWDEYYSLLKNLALIRNDVLAGLENDPEGRTKLAMAKIVEIYAWQVVTDQYGPVPYSESGMPLADLVRQPKYDSQESIYRDLIADLDVALSQLNSGDESYGESDAIYAGDVALWEKFGNALKLRLGMRVKYVDYVLAQTTVEEALSSPLISGNNENADVPTYTETWRHPTLMQSEGGSPDYFYLAEKFVDVLASIGDPRLPLVGDTTMATAGTPDAEFKGVKVAQTDDYYASIIRNQYSLISSQTYFNQGLEIPIHLLSYGEVCFFKAEAALEGWGGLSDTDAETFYRDGILAAMEMEPYNIAEADISIDYIANEFALTGLTKEAKLEKIMTQKWILLFLRNFEAWSEWKRTGYPVLVPGPDGEGVIPRRLIYPVSESALNSANYEDAVATLSNGDTYQSKVWWDAK